MQNHAQKASDYKEHDGVQSYIFTQRLSEGTRVSGLMLLVQELLFCLLGFLGGRSEAPIPITCPVSEMLMLVVS